MSSVPLITQQPVGDVPQIVARDHSKLAHSNWVVLFFLQVSHRVGAVALFATIATWGMMYCIRDFHVPLAIAGGCADAGLCSALIARMLTRGKGADGREAFGAAIFNLVLFVLALYMMIFARLDVIRSAASAFFTPTPPIAAHS